MSIQQRIARLFPYVRELEKAHDELCDQHEKLVMGDITVEQLFADKTGTHIKLGGELCKIMATCFWEMLVESGGENCLEMVLVSPDKPERFTVTLKYEKGKTPMELLAEAKAEIERLKGVEPIETYTYGPGQEPHVWNIYGADKETSEIVCVGEDTAQMVCRALNLYGDESEVEA